MNKSFPAVPADPHARQLSRKRSVLKQLNAEIADRRQYKAEQEVAIAKIVEEGNLQLKGLHYEILEARQILKDLKLERVNLSDERNQLLADIEQARRELQSLLQ